MDRPESLSELAAKLWPYLARLIQPIPTDSAIGGSFSGDHGGLSGLADDDHTQYWANGTRSWGATLVGGTADNYDVILKANNSPCITLDKTTSLVSCAAGLTAAGAVASSGGAVTSSQHMSAGTYLLVNSYAEITTSLKANEGAGDNDSYVKGDTDSNLTYWDAGNNRVGFGTSTPQGKVDIRGGAVGGALYWEYANVDGTARVVLPAGSVTRGAWISWTAWADGTGTLGAGANYILNGGNLVLWTDGGTNVCDADVTAGGELHVHRSAGADTYDVNLWVLWQ